MIDRLNQEEPGSFIVARRSSSVPSSTSCGVSVPAPGGGSSGLPPYLPILGDIRGAYSQGGLR